MHQKAGTILRLFRTEDGYISGQHLSRELGISRTAVWKHITALRNSGYSIEATPSRGYRLVSSPDTIDQHEVRAHLNSARVGRQLEFIKQTGSTNADTFRLAENGAIEGTVVLADSQTGGKGRRGRLWSSPAGVNLYCSVVLRPAIMPHEAPQLTFLSAVAAARAIEQTTKLTPEIKWPNDLLLSGKKVAGLLNEMSAETDGINFVILGIGVNLNMTADQFPNDLRHPATSLLLESGTRVDRSHFTGTMLNELDRLYADFLAHGFGPVREEWQRRCNANGRQVTVNDSGTECTGGRFIGIDSDGAMLLKSDEGTIHRITCGDVRVI
ncbi:MAG: biotin--[acetyl-CoA-carboxylase] ligase [Desulfuromonadaceae bacterium]|nr:biotin--[acetyl-CoA-carboxylase] ligase [Desulfuromonadaceae bacterium]MDD2848265.1 biotin--[acetyl-CoA-carboxylase] ligase [Desulfuromonadaceae bacterium]MDD4130568.1 biotin--[acetyl-CoA-carboxylase] ligase [Desulfuromonadaceae bacterium]